MYMHHQRTRPANNITIELKIQWNFAMFFFITHSADHNKILHMSWQ